MLTYRSFVASVVCVVGLGACGGDPDGPSQVTPDAMPDAADISGQMIGPAGGTVSIANGPTLTIPAGALAMPTTITITLSAIPITGAVTPVYTFAPAGLTFAIPATVTWPVSPSNVPLSIFWSSSAGTSYEELVTQSVSAASLSASVTHFSNAYVAPTAKVATGTHYSYVVSSLVFPKSNADARNLGLDLNADQTVDNQLGMVFSTLYNQGIDMTAATTFEIDRGTLLVLGELQTTGFSTAQDAGFATRLGATPSPSPCLNSSDTTCRRHLAGTGSFTVASSDPGNSALVGNTVSGVLTAGPGHAVLQISFHPGRVVSLDLLGARVKLGTTTANAIGASVIAGGISQTEIDTKIVPEWAYSINAAVQADCDATPSCVCQGGSTGSTWQSLYDIDDNCTVTTTEVKNNSLTQSLLAPDVMLEGQQALSIGLGFTAVKATIAP